MKRILVILCVACCHLATTAQPIYTLRQLTDSALQNNLSMRQAQHGIEAAREQRREAFTKYFPNVSATGMTFNANRSMAKMDINPSQMISPELGASLAQILPPEALASMASPTSMTMMKNGSIVSVMATQPVFAGGQIVNGNRLARVGEEVSEQQLQLAENEVEKTVSQYYWQLVSLHEKQNTIMHRLAFQNDYTLIDSQRRYNPFYYLIPVDIQTDKGTSLGTTRTMYRNTAEMLYHLHNGKAGATFRSDIDNYMNDIMERNHKEFLVPMGYVSLQKPNEQFNNYMRFRLRRDILRSWLLCDSGKEAVVEESSIENLYKELFRY